MTTETALVPGTITPIEATPTAAAPAPAAAPAAAPAPAEAVKADLPVAGVEGDKKGTFEYATTQHAGLDAALGFVGKHGFGPDHPAIKAAVSGDFSLLRAQLAEKGAAGSDAYMLLAENAYKELGAKEQAKRDADQATLYQTVGGEDNWKAIQEWAGKNAEPDEAEAVKGMLAKGGVEMKIAAQFLAGAYQRSTGGVQETDGAGPAVSETRGTAGPAVGALSPQEYGRAVEKARLEHRGSGDFESTPTYAKLREARSRYKG